MKQVYQLEKDDFVLIPKGGKHIKEQVISIKVDEKDDRITYITTKSGMYDSYTFGYVLY
jgi:hypothetical protein